MDTAPVNKAKANKLKLMFESQVLTLSLSAVINPMSDRYTGTLKKRLTNTISMIVAIISFTTQSFT